MKGIRALKFAGAWYPADIRSLNRIWQEAQLSLHPGGSPPAPAGTAFGAVLPHAGLVYSAAGQLAALQQFSLENSHIILIAPSHYQLLRGYEFFSADISSMETPYGNLRVQLPRNPGGLVRYPLAQRAMEDEHAIELLLPGIGALTRGDLPGTAPRRDSEISSITLEPLLTPRLDLANRDAARKQIIELGRQLDERVAELEARGRKTRIFISSDYSHYGPRFSHTPAGGLASRDARRRLRVRDLSVASAAAAGRWEDALEIMLENDPPSICGIAGILAFARFASVRELSGRLCAYYSSATLGALDATAAGGGSEPHPVFNFSDDDVLEEFYDGSQNSVSYCSGVWYES